MIIELQRKVDNYFAKVTDEQLHQDLIESGLEFYSGIKLDFPYDMCEMADRVGLQMDQRKKEDIAAWADLLAEDLSKMTD